MTNILPIMYAPVCAQGTSIHRFTAARASLFASAQRLARCGPLSGASGDLGDQALATAGVRGSAAAAAFAAEIGLLRGHVIVALFTQDVHIEDEAAFADDCARAAETARGGAIVCLGAPTRDAVRGAGYIRPGPRIGERLFTAGRFVHAADLATAWACVQRKDVLNLGAWFFPPKLMRDEMETQAPALSIACRLAAGRIDCARAMPAREALVELPDDCLADVMSASPRTMIAASSACAPIRLGAALVSA